MTIKNKKLIRASLAFLMLILVACQANKRIFNTQSSKSDTYQSDFNVQLGLSYLQIGNMQEAKLKLIKALHQSPDSADANGAMAYYLDKTGEVGLAEEYYKKSIRFAQQKGPYFNNYGVFLCGHQRYQEALDYFSAAVQDEEYLNTAAAYENAGLCMRASHQWEEASEYFLLALRTDPHRPISLLELAKISVMDNAFKRARDYLEDYEKLVEQNLDSAQLGYKIAAKLDDREQMEYYSSLLSRYEKQVE